MSRWFGLVARLVTGAVWVVAGAAKLPDPAASVRAVRAYDLLPEAIVPTVGHALPLVEVVLGVCLLLGLLTRPAAVVSAVLFVAFVVGIAAAWARGLEIDCGCFGGGGRLDGAAQRYPWDLARDAGLLLLSGWLVLRPRTPLALDAFLLHPAPTGAATPTERTEDVEEERRRVEG